MRDGPLDGGGERMPALRRELLHPPDMARLEPAGRAEHSPRILLLYGSLRERSYSRLLVEEADRLLRMMGAETRIFDPRELPMANSTGPDHPKVQELRALSLWSEGQVWCSPEMHGAVTGVFLPCLSTSFQSAPSGGRSRSKATQAAAAISACLTANRSPGRLASVPLTR